MRDREPERERDRNRELPERTYLRPAKELNHRIRTFLSEPQMEVLDDVGRFRVVNAKALTEFRYKGNRRAMERDLEYMQKMGLVSRTAVPVLDGPLTHVVTLTKTGAQLARHQPAAPGQKYYAGAGREAELMHDAGIYRMYQAEAAELQRQGMKVKRVVLEHELKGEVWGRTGKAKQSWTGADKETRLVVAKSLELKTVVDPKTGEEIIQFPDLRLEYETPQGELARADIELTTPNYRAHTIAAKRSCGMRIYGLRTNTWGVLPKPKPDKAFSR